MAKAKKSTKTPTDAPEIAGGSHLGSQHWRHRDAIQKAHKAATQSAPPKTAEAE
jgi:tagatose-1,6-bisphosphate aldolase non-catalytic subunit AgaZ/GatZ